IVGRDRPWPHDPVVVMVLLDDRSHRARRADAVAAHDEQLLLAVFVEVSRAERLRIERLELEDMTEFDRRLRRQRAAAPRTAVAFAKLTDVRELCLVIPP